MNTFDPATHTYAIDGRPIPSVTQVLACAGLSADFHFLDRAVLDHKRQIGTALHKALHYYLENDLDEASLDPEVRGRFGAFEQFCKDTGFKAREAETTIWAMLSGMPYAGTLDVLGVMRSQPYLIDFKCSDGQPHYSWAVQTAAYAHGISPPLHPPFRWLRASLQLFADGSYKFHEWKDRGDLDEFCWALALTHRRMARGENIWK